MIKFSTIQKSVRNVVFVKEQKIIPANEDHCAHIRVNAQSYSRLSNFLLDEVQSIVERPPTFLPDNPDPTKLKDFLVEQAASTDMLASDALFSAAKAYERAVKKIDDRRSKINSKGEFTAIVSQLEECIDMTDTILIGCAARDRTWRKLQSEKQNRSILREKAEEEKATLPTSQSNTLSAARSHSFLLVGDATSEEIDDKIKPTQTKNTTSFMRKLSFSPSKIKTMRSIESVPDNPGLEQSPSVEVTGSGAESTMAKTVIKTWRNISGASPSSSSSKKARAARITDLNARIARHDEKIVGLEFMLKEQTNELQVEYDRILGNKSGFMEEIVAELFHHITELASGGCLILESFQNCLPSLLESSKQRRVELGLPARRYSWQEAHCASPRKAPRHQSSLVESQGLDGPEMFTLNTVRVQPLDNYQKNAINESSIIEEVSNIESLYSSDSSSDSSSIPPPTTARNRGRSLAQNSTTKTMPTKSAFVPSPNSRTNGTRKPFANEQ